ncbi:CCA tRNA nucleotidyltransferase [Synechococcus sp. HK05]|uniref:CCA tRNA nucleotidyltransferase n=1 Tax=Synechococcus sp. HK05 TaxID=2725975 RepID=UPI001C38158E|nr:CCA tRNA nucleotidyltransferase [Synechococcus sp. HK05]MBV2352045.1 CCA tRNA nucleotidyltransferase [Synechococcus sp. HK05]
MQIPEVPIALITALVQAAEGRRLALVGGAVRDLLLHHQHRDPWRGLPDLDLVVEGRAMELVERLPARLPPGSRCGFREHGSFGTVEVELQLPDAETWLLDVASARQELYPSPAENPLVSPGSLDDDLARRDFSVNAIALVLGAGSDGVVLLDPHHGQQDLAARRLRLLHANSLVDDPTRLIRAARYAARLCFELDPSAEQQARRVLQAWPWGWRPGALAQLVPAALGTRLRMELELLLEREPWLVALDRLQAWGGLVLLDPGLQRNRRWRLALLRATRWELPLLPVLIACAEDPVALAQRLQVPHRHQRWLKGVVQLRRHAAALPVEQLHGWTPAQWTAWIEQQPDPEHVVPLVLACGGLLRRPLLRWWLRWRHVQSATTAQELLASGLRPGPAIGERLRQLRAERLRDLECR